MLNIDKYLMPYLPYIRERYINACDKLKELNISWDSISEFACGYLYFGLHKTNNGWIFREYAPNAISIDFIVGMNSNNNWISRIRIPMYRIKNGEWEVFLPDHMVTVGTLYRLHVKWPEGEGERLPAWCNRVIQDSETYEFSAQVYESSYKWGYPNPTSNSPLLIYEAHIGMSNEELGIATFSDFRKKRLKYIKDCGYTAIQLMGVMEHPYYGSYGYHVSSFFAVSSRFGTPDDFKKLIDEAHRLGLRIIIDLVHSHSVKNELEGIGNLDGNPSLYFMQGKDRIHPLWDSLCFDYSKGSVLHFLLSNCKYWIEEYRIDGFRFDGVTSMLYKNHGIGMTFENYGKYFLHGNINKDAQTYLILANYLIHAINKNAITVSEDVSGIPGMTNPIEDGGFGFDFRLDMGMPDYWDKVLKESSAGKWDTYEMFKTLTNRRDDEKTVSYSESHDQAIMGDQTISFRLLKERTYDSMHASNNSETVKRATALHKLIRLVTLASSGNGYMNFMGNEFGHPEWIDFPRKGNGWSFNYARRQWSLNNCRYKYYELGQFDKLLIRIVKAQKDFFNDKPELAFCDNVAYILIIQRGNLHFFFNFGDKPYEITSEYYFNSGRKILTTNDVIPKQNIIPPYYGYVVYGPNIKSKINSLQNRDL